MSDFHATAEGRESPQKMFFKDSELANVKAQGSVELPGKLRGKSIDGREHQMSTIQGCIEALTSFDSQKRELMQYKQIIKNSFGQLLSDKCAISKAFFLEKFHHPELAMNIRLLDLDDASECDIYDDIENATDEHVP